MKNLLLYILLSFLFFGCSEKKSENDIKNWDIEGIRIGDSLLNYMTKEEIIREIESSKNMYQNLTDEFGQVHLNRGFNKYDFLSFSGVFFHRRASTQKSRQQERKWAFGMNEQGPQ